MAEVQHVCDLFHCMPGRDVMMAENQHGGMRLKEGEDRRLFPVLQQTSKPYQEHHPQGDLWLQSMWKEGGRLDSADSVRTLQLSHSVSIVRQDSNLCQQHSPKGDMLTAVHCRTKVGI